LLCNSIDFQLVLTRFCLHQFSHRYYCVAW